MQPTFLLATLRWGGGCFSYSLPRFFGSAVANKRRSAPSNNLRNILFSTAVVAGQRVEVSALQLPGDEALPYTPETWATSTFELLRAYRVRLRVKFSSVRILE